MERSRFLELRNVNDWLVGGYVISASAVIPWHGLSQAQPFAVVA